MTTLFLTGASGFLGGHLLRELTSAGNAVRCLSRSAQSDTAITALGGEPVRAALDDVTALTAAMRGCEAVFHAAADTSLWRRQAAQQMATNVGGTQALLRAAEAAGVGAFLHTSSISAYSHLARPLVPGGPLTEDCAQRGGESWITYERSKYLAEQAVRASALPWTVFQPTNILGPGDRHNWARLILMIDRRELPGLPPGLGVFADVREVARAQVRAWQRKCVGRAYLLGGEHASYVEFARLVGTALGRPTPAQPLPAWAMQVLARVFGAGALLTGREPRITPEGATLTSQQRRVDSARARAELDYRETPLDALLPDTLAWMQSEGMLSPSAG